MDVTDQVRTLTASAVDVISERELVARLVTGRPLRVKLGIDPTAPDIHLGFAAVLRRLRQFQDLGHVAVLILGDFTALIGDPSGRSASRPHVTRQEVDAHAETYLQQVSRILDLDGNRIEIRRNSEWLSSLDMEAVLRLTASTTVARMLERDDFANRYRSGSPISLVEFLYPLLQGYDSVEVRADLELGGTDQLFNNLMGRHLQEQRGQAPQVVLTLPLLDGRDGIHKMSKSLDNYIGITEPPREQFGKVMSIPDALMPSWFRLTTGWDPVRIDATLAELPTTDAAGRNAAKRLLARSVVELYHGGVAAAEAEAEFDRIFKEHQPPRNVPDVTLPSKEFSHGAVPLARVLVVAGLAGSNKDGRRKIEQRGVRIDGEPVENPDLSVQAAEVDGRLVQVGRRKWARLHVK